jgi:hypothetical protein
MKCALRIIASVTTALALLAFTGSDSSGQPPGAVFPGDTVFQPVDTLGLRFGVSQRRVRLVVASGKTYNRVEGLPMQFGPAFTTHAQGLRLNVEAFGILRTADAFDWDSRNRGHILTADARSAGGRGGGLKLALYDVVGAVEEWQMPAGEAGLAAFFLHRDYRDYFARRGESLTAMLFAGAIASLDLGLADERWSAREVRRVLTVLRNNHQWRPNPEMDEGKARLLTARGTLDTRNDVRMPSTGWLTRLEYEYGNVNYADLAATSPIARDDPAMESRYGRMLLDVRRYNRISPESQLNFRVVAGGWLHGDELPLQRRFSVGGPATIPGVRFRDVNHDPDVFTCSADAVPAGSPAQCERVLLFQLEYRDELPFRPGTIFGGTPVRIRSAALTMRPVLVTFVDVGRGWLVAPKATATPVLHRAPVSDQRGLDVIPGNAAGPRGLTYGRGAIPPLHTFSADVGLGIDLGLIGAYMAVSLTESGAPISLFLRARSRF